MVKRDVILGFYSYTCEETRIGDSKSLAVNFTLYNTRVFTVIVHYGSVMHCVLI